MNPEILKRIDLLAAKLGTTASQVWEIFLKQAKVEVWEDLGLTVLGTGLIIGGAFLARWATKQFQAASYNNKDLYIAPVVIGWLVGLLGGVLLLVGSLSIWTPLLNPQYWALQQILSIFSGK
jgi:hypothetical protein